MPATNSLIALAHTHKHLVSFVLLSSTFPPYTPPHPPNDSPPPSPPSTLCLHLHFLASLPSRPFEVWDSSKSNFFSPSLSLWTEGLDWVGISGANQNLWNRGWSSIGADNHESARPSVARCEKEFWIWIRPKELDVTFIHTTRTTVKIGKRTELLRQKWPQAAGSV